MNRKQRRTAEKISKKQPAAGTSLSAADQVVRKAIAVAQLGALADAESAIGEVLARFPDHVEALHQKGMLLARTNRVEEGIALLRRVTEAKPGEALYWNNLAAACLTIDRSDEALPAARKAVELDPKYAMAWRNLAMAATDLGQHHEATDALARASELSPKDVEVWSRLGVAQLELGDAARAETAFAKALVLDPKNAQCLSNLGVLLAKRGRATDALPHLEKAVEIEPDRFIAALHYGIVLTLAGDQDQGIALAAPRHLDRSALACGVGRAGRCRDRRRRAGRGVGCRQARRRVRTVRSESSRAPAETAATGAQPRSTLVDLDLGGAAQSPDRDQAADTDLSKSLDQIFIR